MRYLPLDATDRALMLTRVGVADIDELFADIPADKRLNGLVDIPTRKSEIAVERALAALAARNVAAGSVPFFLGAGAYRHHVPASVDHLIQRSEFLTSYTPYQPEIAQGTLQVLFEFQTQVAALTGMEVANASMYDGSTACGEAVLMAHRLTRRKKAVLSGGLHPQYGDVVATLSGMAGDDVGGLRPMSAPAKTSPRRSMARRAASSFRTLISSAICAISRRSRPPLKPRARCLSLSSPKRFRWARSVRPARWAPTSSSAKASRSAMR